MKPIALIRRIRLFTNCTVHVSGLSKPFKSDVKMVTFDELPGWGAQSEQKLAARIGRQTNRVDRKS